MKGLYKKSGIDTQAVSSHLPTYLPTYIQTYIPTYLPTHLPTYLQASRVLTHIRKLLDAKENLETYGPQAMLTEGDDDEAVMAVGGR